jgi:hypothetical protein
MKPERAQLAALSAVLSEDLAALGRLDAQLRALSPGLDRAQPDFRDLAALAYLMHNIYNALENSFEQISRTFENHITNQAQWHKELLQKMFLAIPTVRPAVLPVELRPFLTDLRSFRHVFRHSYDFEIRADLLHTLVRSWSAERERTLAALAGFRDYLLSTVEQKRSDEF